MNPAGCHYYESRRVPPADVLVKIAQVAGVDLHWLLTGRPAPAVAPTAQHPVIARAARLLADNPAAAEPLAAFIQVLAETARFPENPFAAEPTAAQAPRAAKHKAPKARADGPRTAQPRPGHDAKPSDLPAGAAKEDWIPLLGRTAAGVAQFWADHEDTAGLTALQERVNRYARARPQRVQDATAAWPEPAELGPIQLITLTCPREDEPAEFVAAAAFKARYPDAFALRIDGESMAPDIRHGDIVLLSPSVPAAQGRPAVVQLARQIGVTCKLYHRREDRVHLVPINEQYPPQAYPVQTVVWALRVLGCIRG